MIIGHGDIASVIPDRPDRCYFAAGVSNSQETRESEYRREYELLLEQPRDAHIVYFSSLCVFYSKTRYASHKLGVEQAIKLRFAHHTIVRLGNIDFGKNPHTLINFMRARVDAGLPIEVQNVYRVIHTKADLLYGLSLIPEWSCELSVPGRLIHVSDIVQEYVPGVYWNGMGWARGNGHGYALQPSHHAY